MKYMLGATALMYAGTGMWYAVKGQWWLALFWTCYAVANAAFILGMK